MKKWPNGADKVKIEVKKSIRVRQSGSGSWKELAPGKYDLIKRTVQPAKGPEILYEVAGTADYAQEIVWVKALASGYVKVLSSE